MRKVEESRQSLIFGTKYSYAMSSIYKHLIKVL